MGLNILFLMDPLDTVDAKKDTSFALMEGAVRAGHNVYFLPQGGITYTQGVASFDVTQVLPNRDNTPPFDYLGTHHFHQDKVDVVMIRTDPPFNDQYLMDTWLLDILPERIFVFNRPSGIRSTNEKVWAAQFTSMTPNTLITRHKRHFLEFLDSEQKIVGKPLNAYGGSQVFAIHKSDTNAHVIFETLTRNQTLEAKFQSYVPEADAGDKRILLLNGDPLGAINRVHSPDDHRNNFFAGGRAEPIDITDNDRQIIAKLRPFLIERGLYFVGIDIIGTHLIEVNVTSPTGLQHINLAYDLNLEDEVIAFIESQVTVTGQ